MRKVALLLFPGLLTLSAAAQAPRGTLLELHSCEVYAGGCVVSGEATQGGRYMVRVWSFTEGTYAGADLKGLQVAVLQASSDNLAARGSDPGQAVVYLPQAATEAQRKALRAWMSSTEPVLEARAITRIVPISLAPTASGYKFIAGKAISIETAPLESCPTGACGESLWYSPRASTSLFTVAVNRASSVSEPALKLHWQDAGKKSVFVGKFGDGSPTTNLYVSSAELCAPTGKLF